MVDKAAWQGSLQYEFVLFSATSCRCAGVSPTLRKHQLCIFPVWGHSEQVNAYGSIHPRGIL